MLASAPIHEETDVKRVIALFAAIVTALIFAVVMVVGWSVGRGAGSASAPGTAGVASTATPHYYLMVHRGEQLDNEPLGPAYLPSTFTLPANTTVTLTITNFDDATPLPDNAAKYLHATGVEHNQFRTAALDPKNPNAVVPSTPATSADPATVSHTFTIPKLNLSVPLPANSTVTFSFHTPAAGTLDWRCMDPCGIGPVGWNGAMSTDGYMQGKVTFA